MKIRSHIRSVRLVFSIFLFQILAGLTGCKDDGTEFMEKELVQEESGSIRNGCRTEEPKDTESEVSGKDPQRLAADISTERKRMSPQKKAEITEDENQPASAIQQPSRPSM